MIRPIKELSWSCCGYGHAGRDGRVEKEIIIITKKQSHFANLYKSCQLTKYLNFICSYEVLKVTRI